MTQQEYRDLHNLTNSLYRDFSRWQLLEGNL